MEGERRGRGRPHQWKIDELREVRHPRDLTKPARQVWKLLRIAACGSDLAAVVQAKNLKRGNGERL
jgi:hypothetical protein